MIELRALERYARRRSEAATCELCATPIDTEHRHVVDTVERKLQCTCRACALVFDHDKGRLRAVPTEVRHAAKPFDAQQRAKLKVPVGLVFFLKSSALGRWVAIFPSPAGATEAELDDEAIRVLDESPFAKTRDDVEAVLVRTHRDGRCECLVTPVDVCYECVASLRMHWKGIAGGDEAHGAIDAIIARARERGRS